MISLGGCEDYETESEARHREEMDKMRNAMAKLRANIEKALNNPKIRAIYACIMHYAMQERAMSEAGVKNGKLQES